MPESRDALKVEVWKTERPQPYPTNARVVPDAAVRKVAASIKAFGFRNPILVDGEGVVIAGHTRLLAAEQLKLKVVPVIVCADLSPAKARALRLADNRTAQETTWEYERLNLELEELAGLDFDVSLTGFDPDELAGISYSGKDYSDLDSESGRLAGSEEVSVTIVVPERYEQEVMEWLANGNTLTGPGMGLGVLARCGLLS